MFRRGPFTTQEHIVWVIIYNGEREEEEEDYLQQ